jgi:hypothetical protein
MLPNEIMPFNGVSPAELPQQQQQQQQQRVLAVKTEVQEAVRSIDNAVLWSSHQAVATNEQGTKRAHISAELTSASLPQQSAYTHRQSDLHQQEVYGVIPQPPDTSPLMQYGLEHPPPKEDPQVAIENIKAFNAMAQAASNQDSVTDVQLQHAWGGSYTSTDNESPSMPSLSGGFIPDQATSLSGPAPQYGIPIDSTAPNQVPPQPDTVPKGKPCRIQGCNNFAVARRPYCAKHSGNRLCERDGCTKCAQGSTRFCIAHGGGRRCTFPGCDKGARDKFFCAAHGGGKTFLFRSWVGCTCVLP